MPFRFRVREQLALGWFLVKWLGLAIPLGVVVGSACALFLWSLDTATATRLRHPDLVYLLPLAGMAIGALYLLFGKSVEAGNNLIMEEIHEPGGGVPLRMAPLILIGTVVTHLFGGSAGREGTAVQMGGSLASGCIRLFPQLSRADVRIMLMAGVSAGFGGVFGTPVAGTIFALEVLAIGRMNLAALVPCLIAGIASDQACIAWGIQHTHYHVASQLPAGSALHLAPVMLPLLGKVVLAAALFGLTSVLFSECVHGLHQLFKTAIRWPVLRPAAGGMLVIVMMWLLGTRDYLGLGVSSAEPGQVSILSSFQPGGAGTWSWLWKLLFTAVTLGSGFKGGEVTPLFFIGAALGNTLALLLGAPVDLFAALGFLSVFAGATNTPLACTLMGIELFGGEYAVYFAVATFTAYLFSGHSGIYLSQRIGTPKTPSLEMDPAETLRAARNPAPDSTLSGRTASAFTPDFTETGGLPAQRQEMSREIGQLCIYLPQGETPHGMGLQSLFGRPLFRELMDLAHADGIRHATSHAVRHGYSRQGSGPSNVGEFSGVLSDMDVELMDYRDQLERFCRDHADQLRNHRLVYRPLEHWELPDQSLEVTAPPTTGLEGRPQDSK